MSTGEVYKIVLTGGPCAGKTSVLSVLSDFFDKRGWKVYRVPEAATVLLGGGVAFSELDAKQAAGFQSNLLKTMIQIENTFFDLATSAIANGSKQNIIIICDRGAMDPSAYTDPQLWQEILEKNQMKTVELRDGRYDAVIHLVTAAIGAEQFYTTENNSVRKEGLELARELDKRISEAWLGHPYLDIIDNSTGFKEKMQRVVHAVCKRIGLSEVEMATGKKRKYLVKSWPAEFPIKVQDFDVEHDYLVTSDTSQARIRRRGQNGEYTYTHTERRPLINNQRVEVRRSVLPRDYVALRAQKDPLHHTIYKLRRCFVHNSSSYQLDIFLPPSPPKCQNLALLETYVRDGQEVSLPEFLEIEREVTDDARYSMHNLSAVDGH